MGAIAEFFSNADFMPHGHCYLWKPELVWTMVITDALIGLAYVSISISLYLLVRKIRLPFSAMFIAFGLFIAACGATHFMEILNLWVPNYWLAALVKVITASASVATALLMFPVRPKIEVLAATARLAEERRIDLEVQKRAVELRDEFLSIASHELRTPVTPLKMQVQIAARMIRKAQDTDAPVDVEGLGEVFQISLRQIDRLTGLIENLLDVSRIQSGQLIGEFQSVNLASLVRDVATRFTEQLNLAGCTLELDLDDSLVGMWDKIRIEQVVTNLISNAMKYGAGKPISVSVRRKGDSVVFEVEDHGIGIPKGKQSKIFERFERAVSSINISGLGLGLYIVKQIIDAHGGVISVESVENKGSTFSVTLPMNSIGEKNT